MTGWSGAVHPAGNTLFATARGHSCHRGEHPCRHRPRCTAGPGNYPPAAGDPLTSPIVIIPYTHILAVSPGKTIRTPEIRMANRIDYAVVNDWGSGLQAGISLIPDHQLNGWTLEFDAAYAITQIWNARIVSHVGTHYVIRNLDWNAAVPSGGSVSFGFLAGPGPAPAGYALDGQAIGTTPAPPAELPAASVADISVTEGNSGESLANFIVTLAKASTIPVTLNFTTRDGTARAGSDYVAASGTVTFAPGETSKVIKVAVLGDTVVEANESFNLSCPARPARRCRRPAPPRPSPTTTPPRWSCRRQPSPMSRSPRATAARNSPASPSPCRRPRPARCPLPTPPRTAARNPGRTMLPPPAPSSLPRARRPGPSPSPSPAIRLSRRMRISPWP